jgi:hypothetical protein
MAALTALITLSVGVFGGILLSFTGVAVGAAARYGLPARARLPGGLVLSIAGGLLLAWLTARAAGDEGGGSAFDWFAPLVAGWLPGFIAAALGANRFVLIATFPMGLVLGAFVASAIGFNGSQPL